MCPSRPKLTLDEQSFQDMLGAAFTIQEHNLQRKRDSQPPAPACEKCGAALANESSLCEQCTVEAPRPGEELQRKWASLWLMSQEQGLWTERLPAALDEPERAGSSETATAELPAFSFPDVLEIPVPAEENADTEEEEAESEWRTGALAHVKSASSLPEVAPHLTVAVPEFTETISEETAPPRGFRDLRLKLRFHRADLYLVVSIAVATVAMLWVLSATPTPGAHSKPHLRAWEKALIAMGLAEAPEAPPKRGDPNIQVWVDPKTALYYCAGEELYGKAPGGHATTQRDARLDGFEPAGRAACE